MNCEDELSVVLAIIVIEVVASAYSRQISVVARFAPNLSSPTQKPRLGGRYVEGAECPLSGRFLSNRAYASKLILRTGGKLHDKRY